MFNNGFPIGYSYPHGMTPPTIHADIVQVSGEDAAWAYPVAAGSTQMMMDRDDSAIYVKSAYPNSQPTLDIYRKDRIRPQKPLEGYVTREELAEALEALKSPEKGVKKEAAE